MQSLTPSRKLRTAGAVLVGLCLMFAGSLAQAETLRVAPADLPSSLDPQAEASNTAVRITYNMFDTLIRMDPDNRSQLHPSLATDWEWISDQELELRLRQDVVFHNGDPFTAADVKYSYERATNPEHGFAQPRSLLAIIESVEVVDDYTVRVRARVPDPILEYRLATPWGAWILPADYATEVGLDAFGRQPVGTGPFELVSIAPDRIELRAFDDYWGTPPHIGTLIYREIPETAGRVTAVINREVDIVTQIPPDQVARLQREPHINVQTQSIANIHMLVFNPVHPPTDDVRIRQAMNLAIDREMLTEALWLGMAEVPRGHQFPDYGLLYDPDRPIQEHNPERARELVEEAGYDGTTIYYDTLPAYYTAGDEAAEAIIEMWRAIGLNAQIRFTNQFWQNDDRHVHTWSNTMRFPDPLGGLWLLWGRDSGRQTNEWVPQGPFNELGAELERSFDSERRFEIYQQMLDIWEEEAPGSTLWYPTESWAVNEDIEWTAYRGHEMDFGADNLRVNR